MLLAINFTRRPQQGNILNNFQPKQYGHWANILTCKTKIVTGKICYPVRTNLKPKLPKSSKLETPRKNSKPILIFSTKVHK